MTSQNTGTPRPAGNSRIIAKNTLWNSVELIFGLIANLFTSVLIARIIGRDAAGQARLGSYQYIVWLTTITLTMGSFGLSSTAWKYMAEYLNTGHPEIARATYLATLRVQSLLSLGAAAIGLIAVRLLGDPHYFVASALLVAAIVPRLIATIPSGANNAAEAVRRNATPAVVGILITAVVTLVSLSRGWDFVGLSAAVLMGAAVECLLKLRSVEQWLGNVPKGLVAPELRKRMLNYSGQGLALMLLNLLVWDRSDIIILQALNPDTRQITFFSLSFSLADRILMIPTLFVGALGFTMMAQHGRGVSRLREMTVDGGRYTLLIALPLLAGMACIARPLVLLVYSSQYRPMISTLTIIAILAIPKALVAAPTRLLQATEKLGFLILLGCSCGAVDIGLDFLLVRRYGANGAAIANGAAQALAALGTWIYVWRVYKLDLKLADCGRIVISGAIMALGVLAIGRAVPGLVGLPVAIAVGAALWMISLRITSALKPEDVGRFLSVSAQFPTAIRPMWKRLIAWLAPTLAVE